MRTIAFLFLTAASCSGSAIITTSTVCTTSCTGPETQAAANVSNTSVSVQASYTGRGSPEWLSAIATAILDDDLTLTLHGGTGMGFFTPCFSMGAWDAGYVSGSGSSVSANFGTFDASLHGSCSQIGAVIPIAFDTPTQFHLRIYASAYADNSLPHGNGASALASFNGLRVQSGASYTLVESTFEDTLLTLSAPEPATILLAGLAFAALAGLKAASRRRC